MSSSHIRGQTDLYSILRGLSARLNDGRFVYTQIIGIVPADTDPFVPYERADDAMRALATLTTA